MRDVEVAAAEALDGPTEEDLEAIRARDVHGRGDRRAREDPRPRHGGVRRRAGGVRGPAGRWIHYGLTSSDVVDTGLALQLKRAGALLVPAQRALAYELQDEGARARGHAVRRPHPRRARRADVVRPQARGLRDGVAPQRRPAGARLRPDHRRRSPARSGTFATLGPDYETRVVANLGLQRRAGLDAGRAARPPRGAAAARSLWPAPGWSASRPRSATCSAPRCARSRSRSARARRARRRCRTSATRSSASASAASRGCCAATPRSALENVALWHERDITHSSAERIILPRLHDPARPAAARSRGAS